MGRPAYLVWALALVRDRRAGGDRPALCPVATGGKQRRVPPGLQGRVAGRAEGRRRKHGARSGCSRASRRRPPTTNVIAVLQFSAERRPGVADAGRRADSGSSAPTPIAWRQAAKGRNVSVDVHDAADKRIAACARLSTDAAATCEVK